MDVCVWPSIFSGFHLEFVSTLMGPHVLTRGLGHSVFALQFLSLFSACVCLLQSSHGL